MSIINNHQATTLRAEDIYTINNGLTSGRIMGHDVRDIERAMEQMRANNMLESGDFVIRKVRNGYRVLVAPIQGNRFDEYIAKDLTEVADVLKLATVNGRLDAAK